MEKFHSSVTKELKKIGLTAEFEFIKKINYKADLIFVASLFRMNNPYKSDLKYTEGLLDILRVFPRHFKNMCIRLYIDDSILGKDDKWNDFYDKVLKNPHIEIIKYTFKQFKTDKIFHDTVFGTLLRFLPMFNFMNGTETFIIIDVDYEGDIMQKVIEDIQLMLKTIKSGKTNMILNTYTTEHFIEIPRLEMRYMIKKYDFIQRLILTPLVFNRKIDKRIFIDFLHCLFIRCNEYVEWIDELIEANKCHDIKDEIIKEKTCGQIFRAKQSKKGIFIFGIDEYFLNKDILEYFIKNKIPFSMHYKFPAIAHYHYFMIKTLYKNNLINKKFLENFYHVIFGKNISNDIYKNFLNLDKKIYFMKLKNNLMRFDTEKNINDSESQLYQKKIYNFLKENIENGELYKNIKAPEKKHFLYKAYFSLIKDLPFKTFLNESYVYKITYSKVPNKYIFSVISS
jgi:hypothetical protein